MRSPRSAPVTTARLGLHGRGHHPDRFGRAGGAGCPEPTGEPDVFAGEGVPGHAQLYVDGALVAQSDLPFTTPVAFNLGGLTCGANPGLPVIPDYEAPFCFTGTLHSVTIDISGELITDTESEMRAVMARQ